MKYYVILTAIFMIQLSACSIMNKKIQKSNESAVKKQTVTTYIWDYMVVQ